MEKVERYKLFLYKVMFSTKDSDREIKLKLRERDGHTNICLENR